MGCYQFANLFCISRQITFIKTTASDSSAGEQQLMHRALQGSKTAPVSLARTVIFCKIVLRSWNVELARNKAHPEFLSMNESTSRRRVMSPSCMPGGAPPCSLWPSLNSLCLCSKYLLWPVLGKPPTTGSCSRAGSEQRSSSAHYSAQIPQLTPSHLQQQRTFFPFPFPWLIAGLVMPPSLLNRKQLPNTPA